MDPSAEDGKHENPVGVSNNNTSHCRNGTGWLLKRKRSNSASPEPQTPSQRKRGECENLLPPMLPADEGKYTLVIDMDGTILTEVDKCPESRIDFAIEQMPTGKRSFILKRPGLENFLHQAAQLFEIVVFTESSERRADVLLNMLDNRGCIAHRLYRDSCTEIDGKLAKDLSRLGRDLSKVIIVDDCPFSYVLQPRNAIPVGWYIGNRADRELEAVSHLLKDLVANKCDVRVALKTKEAPHMTMGPLLPSSVSVAPLRHTLVLDMDGTLLVEREQKLPIDEGSDYFTTLQTWPDGRRNKLYVYKRPGLDLFLTEMAKVFEIVVFTLSIKERADYFLDQIDRDKSRISFRLYRGSSYSGIKGKWVKDLSRLGRDLSRVIIIDDTPISYEFQQSNAIPITPFEGLKSDSELTTLIPFLQTLAQLEDVRPLLFSKFDCDIRPIYKSIANGETQGDHTPILNADAPPLILNGEEQCAETVL